MKIILLCDLKNLGKKYDIVEVTKGYANNFLIPNKKAMFATPNNIKLREKALVEIEKNKEKILQQCQMVAKQIEKITLSFGLKAHEGKSFGSISSKMIVNELHSVHGIKIDKHQFDENIKLGIGFHDIHINLHPEVNAVLKVEVKEEK